MLFRPIRANEIADAGQVPSLLAISPEYAALVAREGALNGRRVAAITELRALAKLGEHPAPKARSPEADARRSRIDALVNGNTAAPPAAIDSGIAARFWELKAEIADIDEALPILEKNRRNAGKIASATVCDRMRDVHSNLVREFAASLRDLHELNVRYWALSDAFNAGAVAWGPLGPAFLQAIGHPADREAPLGRWYREALVAGHISASDVPEALR